MEEINLNLKRAMLEIPENAIDAVFTFKIYISGEIKEVKTTMNMSEIRAAIEDAKENYCAPDDIFVLTEEGKRYADKN